MNSISKDGVTVNSGDGLKQSKLHFANHAVDLRGEGELMPLDDERVANSIQKTKAADDSTAGETTPDAAVAAALLKMKELEKVCREMQEVASNSLLTLSSIRFSPATLRNSLDTIYESIRTVSGLTEALTPAATLDKFELFPKLPTELRLKIWKEAVPVSRIVRVTCKQLSDTVTRPKRKKISWEVESSEPVPITLQICHESREQALKKYRLRLDTSKHEGLVRIDPDEDLLVIGGCYRVSQRRDTMLFQEIWKSGMLKSVRHVGTYLEPWGRRTLKLSSIASLELFKTQLAKFKSLETLLLIASSVNSPVDKFSELDEATAEFDELMRLQSCRDIQAKIKQAFTDHSSANPGFKAPVVKLGFLGVRGEKEDMG